MIISLDYRGKSQIATHFRQWANISAFIKSRNIHDSLFYMRICNTFIYIPNKNMNYIPQILIIPISILNKIVLQNTDSLKNKYRLSHKILLTSH